MPVDTDALQYEYAKLKLSHAEHTDDPKSMKQELMQLDDLMEQQGIDIPIPEMPEELDAKPKK